MSVVFGSRFQSEGEVFDEVVFRFGEELGGVESEGGPPRGEIELVVVQEGAVEHLVRENGDVVKFFKRRAFHAVVNSEVDFGSNFSFHFGSFELGVENRSDDL